MLWIKSVLMLFILLKEELKTRTTIVVSNGRYTFYQIHFIKYNLSNNIYPIPFIKYPLSITIYQKPFIKYHLSNTICSQNIFLINESINQSIT